MTVAGDRRYHPRMWSGTDLRRWMTVVLLGVAVLPSFAQHRERKRLERSEILRLEARWRQAQLADDVGEMDYLLSDEFLGITAGGQVVTKMQQLDRMRTGKLDLRRIDLLDTKVKISGNLAVVTSLAELDGSSEGAPLHGAFRYTRVYQHMPGDGWKITNFEATRVNRSADLIVPGLRPAVPGAPPAGGSSSHPASPVESASQPPRS